MTIQTLVVGVLLAGSVGFVSPEAEAVVVDSNTVEYAVSVESPSGTSIVLHALDPGSEQLTLAMLETSSGVYRTRFESRALDYIIVFEDLTSGEQSEPFRLSELGVAPEFVGKSPVVDNSATPEPNESLGWLALGLGLASLSALAFWALGGDRKSAQNDTQISSPNSDQGAPPPSDRDGDRDGQDDA